jgi:hypothetical protein
MNIRCDIRTHYDSMTRDKDINMRGLRKRELQVWRWRDRGCVGEMDEKGDMLSIEGVVSGWVGDP